MPLDSSYSDDKGLHDLSEFKKQWGHCRVPPSWKENPELAQWVSLQRSSHPRLTHSQLRQLFDLGFDFGYSDTRWIQQFLALIDFKKCHGHGNVPARSSRYPALARWVDWQRRRKTHKTQPLDRLQRLNQLGFVWRLMEKTPEKKPWRERLREFKAFRKKHGHGSVPQKYPDNPSLGHWVEEQRSERKNLSVRKKRLLEKAGFDWTPHKTLWKMRYEQLKAFHKRHGHCHVPKAWEENPQLATWARVQRLRQKWLSPVRRRQLNRLGFDWTIHRKAVMKRWEERFKELQAFQAEYGYCQVPAKWKKNPALGQWVYQQRCKWKHHLLAQDRIQKLEQLGFDWSRKITQTLRPQS